MMKIVMSQREIDHLENYLSQADSYFEFGMGGSTCLAAKLVRYRVAAIDSDAEWVTGVRTEIGQTDKIVDLRHVDIGQTGGWGTPISRSNQHLFPSYSKAIVDTGYSDFDLCFVDGRFRVACFLQALQFLRKDAIVGMHDYAARPAYHVVEEFARPISATQQLKFFVQRPGVDAVKLSRTLEAHRLDWA